MVDPTTTNLIMAQPIRASDVGTWDVPVNGNTGILDQAFGGVTTLALTNSPVTLTTSQAQNSVIRLTGTLTGNVAITMASIYKFWTVDNQLVNSPSSYCATILSTGGSVIIGCPPGNTDIYYDGTSVKYRNLDKLGEYWDYVGSTVPSWVTACTNKPYLNCDGTVISSATYPQLVNLLGTTTLPDSRGRYRAALNQTTGRITSSGGVDGNTAYAAGGIQNQSVTIGTSNLPASIPYKDPGHTHALTGASNSLNASISGVTWPGGTGGGTLTIGISSATVGITINPSTSAVGTGNAVFLASLPPSYVGGITMVRTGL